MEQRIYLDYAATAPLLPEVVQALDAGAAAGFGNATALYSEGKKARQALEEARTELAAFLGCLPPQLVFCSGGTEAAGTLIEGIARGSSAKSGAEQARKHIVCAAFEHHAILDSVLSLKSQGYTVELLRPDCTGRISTEALKAVLRPDTLLATVALAQNEIGTVQDIAALAKCAHEVGALFVSDCVQGFGKLPFSLADLGVDGACFSAHKLGGPMGIGAFYLRPQTPFLPRQLGGGQEQKRRSGTQNVLGAVGFARAAQVQLAALAKGEAQRLATLRDELLGELIQGSTRIRCTVPIETGDAAEHLAGFLHVLAEGIESQTMVLKLDELGFAVSGGSACSSSSLEPSHVLTSLGIAKDDAYGALRITLGRQTSREDCSQFAKALIHIL